MDDKYTSVLTAMMGKIGRITEEENERISWGGSYMKNIISEINLNCSTIALKSKWKTRIERVQEDNWVLYSDSSKNKKGRVGSE